MQSSHDIDPDHNIIWPQYSPDPVFQLKQADLCSHAVQITNIHSKGIIHHGILDSLLSVVYYLYHVSQSEQRTFNPGGTVSPSQLVDCYLPIHNSDLPDNQVSGFAHPSLPYASKFIKPLTELDNLKEAWDTYEPSDNAAFWHIPKACGSTMKDVIVYPGGEPVGQDCSPFVNVDTTTIAVADWDPSYRPDLQEWTMEQYATRDIVENNWMTKQLTNQLEDDLNDDHFMLVME
eukprot:11562103-Ditylum_brightwellii.AAC.1